MTDTTIVFGGFPVHEPMTVLTDLIISALCFLYWFRMNASSPEAAGWKKFFLFFGMSTLVGAFSHGLFLVHEGVSYKSVWLGMQLLNGLAVFFAQQASCHSVIKGKPAAAQLHRLSLIQLAAFSVLALLLQNFLVVVINNALGLIPVMVMHFRHQQKTHYSTIAWGIAISFLTAVVHGAKIHLHDYFNHNDLAHVFIMISISVIYLGAKHDSTTPLSK